MNLVTQAHHSGYFADPCQWLRCCCCASTPLDPSLSLASCSNSHKGIAVSAAQTQHSKPIRWVVTVRTSDAWMTLGVTGEPQVSPGDGGKILQDPTYPSVIYAH
jgi:hypothetical protein